MKSNSPIGSGITLAVLGLALAMGIVGSHALADVWDKKTVLTVDQPIQVQETYLEPGTYVFKLANSSSDRHIVQIFNRDQDHLINTILAIPNYRLQPSGDSRFTFYETPPGTARAMHAWFYPGDNYGQEFRYPKHLTQLAAMVTPAPAPPPEPPPPVVTEPAAPQTPAPQPPPQAENKPQPPKEEEPAAIAQNNPPPKPERTPAPEPPKTEAPTELPKTATPYPLIGLGGLVTLAAYGLLRIRAMT